MAERSWAQRAPAADGTVSPAPVLSPQPPLDPSIRFADRGGPIALARAHILRVTVGLLSPSPPIRHLFGYLNLDGAESDSLPYRPAGQSPWCASDAFD